MYPPIGSFVFCIIHCVWAIVETPPKAVTDRIMLYLRDDDQGAAAILWIPLVISINPKNIYRILGFRNMIFCVRPARIEKSIIYPPNLVIDSKPFMIEVSISSISGTGVDTFFLF